MPDILGKLFGSYCLVKIIRLFFLNPDEVFTTKEISLRIKARSGALRPEISLLSNIKFIKRASVILDLKSKKRSSRKRVEGWILNPLFPFAGSLKNLVLNAAPLRKEELIKKIKSTGRVKLIIISGIFLQDSDSRIDLFIVGDSIKKASLTRVLKYIESKVGKELAYTVMPTEEFKYRLGIYDKFIRDILDFPHEKILNKLDFEI